MDLEIIDKELLSKYNCVIDNLERTYYFSFSNVDISLKYTYPIYFEADKFISEDKKWPDVIIGLVKYLSDKCNLIKFKPYWCGTYLFTSVSIKNSWEIKIKDHLFFNYSLAYNHMPQFIVDVLNYSKINKNNIYIKYKRLPKVEPKEIRKAVISSMQAFYRQFMEAEERTEQDIKMTFAYIKYINNHIWPLTSSAYDNIYLLTDKYILKRTIDEFLNVLKTNKLSDNASIGKMQKCLYDYYDFFCFFDKAIKSPHGKRLFTI